MDNIHFSYGNKEVLKNVNLDIKRGMFMGLVGPNGGGKTTLIKIILGLLQPDRGSVYLLNEPLNQFSNWSKIGFVSQKANAFNKNFPATVFEVVAMGLTSKLGYLKFLTKKHRSKIEQAVEKVHMLDYLHENIGNLSGGQQQRVFIARALVSEPALLILDEPTVGVDYQNVAHFYDILHELNEKQHMTLLLVTHDTGAMTKHATDIVCLNKTLHFHGNSQQYTELSAESLTEIYGHPVQVVVHNHD